MIDAAEIALRARERFASRTGNGAITDDLPGADHARPAPALGGTTERATVRAGEIVRDDGRGSQRRDVGQIGRNEQRVVLRLHRLHEDRQHLAVQSRRRLPRRDIRERRSVDLLIGRLYLRPLGIANRERLRPLQVAKAQHELTETIGHERRRQGHRGRVRVLRQNFPDGVPELRRRESIDPDRRRDRRERVRIERGLVRIGEDREAFARIALDLKQPVALRIAAWLRARRERPEIETGRRIRRRRPGKARARVAPGPGSENDHATTSPADTRSRN